MSVYDVLIDGAGDFLGLILAGIAGILTIPAKVVANNRSRSKANEQELGLDTDEDETRLDRLEDNYRGLQEGMARQERDHRRIQTMIAGDDDDPRQSLFERLDDLEKKVDDLHE